MRKEFKNLRIWLGWTRARFFFLLLHYIFRWWSSLSSYISSRAPFHRYMLRAATHIAREHSEHSIQSEIFIHTLFPLTSLLWRRSFFALLLLCGKNSFFSSSARLVFFFCVHRQRAKRVSTTQVIQIISSHLPLCARLVDKLCVHKLCALSLAHSEHLVGWWAKLFQSFMQWAPHEERVSASTMLPCPRISSAANSFERGKTVRKSCLLHNY